MTEAQSVQNNTLYQQMDLWRTKHEINESRFQELANLNQNVFDMVNEEYEKNPTEENFEFLEELDNDLEKFINDYNSTKEEIGTEFDFMEGKDPENEDEYKAQVLKLAQGEIEEKDTDADGKLSAEEYVYSELSGLDKYGENTEEDNDEVMKAALYMFEIMDQKMESSVDDDYLSADELAEFNTHLDEYQGDGTTVRDGKFDIDLSSQYVQYLLEQVGFFK